MSLTRRSAAEVAAVRQLRRALADVASETSAPRCAAEVRAPRASRSERASTGAVEDRPAALRSGLCATVGALGPSRWLRFVKKGARTEVPRTGRSRPRLVRPDDEWWTTRNE